MGLTCGKCSLCILLEPHLFYNQKERDLKWWQITIHLSNLPPTRAKGTLGKMVRTREIKKANEMKTDPWGITFYYSPQQSFKACWWFPNTLTAAPEHPSGASKEVNHWPEFSSAELPEKEKNEGLSHHDITAVSSSNLRGGGHSHWRQQAHQREASRPDPPGIETR